MSRQTSRLPVRCSLPNSPLSAVQQTRTARMSPTFCPALRRTGRPFLPARPRASACRLCGPPGASDSAKPHREISIGRSERERESERESESERERRVRSGYLAPSDNGQSPPPSKGQTPLRSASQIRPPLSTSTAPPEPPALTCSSASDSATLSALTLEAQEGDSPTVTSPEVLH